LGPGLLESAYEAALLFEIQQLGIPVSRQVPLPMVYKSVSIDQGYRVDLIVDSKVIVEVKSVEALADVHHMQVLTYLRLSGLRLGLLVNFNTDKIEKNIVRKVNGL
jgi:GxxExxY protein